MSSSKKLLQSASGFINQSGPLNVEDVFSTHTYTGTDADNNVQVNGIDLLNEGGLVWIKGRDYTGNHRLVDTARGDRKLLTSNNNAGELTDQGATYGLNFNNNGFTVRQEYNGDMNASQTYVSWSFRKAPRFFDIQTWTGDGNAGRTISHNLGIDPGMIIVKRTDTAASWMVWHRSLTNTTTKALYLDANNAEVTNTNYWNSTAPTDTTLTLGSHWNINYNGGTYVGYFFAHDTSSDGMIQCGTFTTDGSGNYDGSTALGFEPQWFMWKAYSSTDNWTMIDSMRGYNRRIWNVLYADANNAESPADSDRSNPTPQGFIFRNGQNLANADYLYMAIRRGPMATPTSRASVFGIDTKGSSGDGKAPAFRLGNIVDMQINRKHATTTDEPNNFELSSRLLSTKYLVTNSGAIEANNSDLVWAYNNGVDSRTSTDGTDYSWLWRRAPGFFDVVVWTGTGAELAVNHNLGVVPEMMWVKCLGDTSSSSIDWAVYYGDETDYLELNTNNATADSITYWWDTAPTATQFTVGSATETNNPETMVAFLFATLAGISKVGTFSHTNGSSTDVDCGFSSGSSYIIVKRTDSTGDWYVWDSARGIVSGNDPYLALNSTDNPVTNTDLIDPLNSGFQIASGFTTGNYIFYAIAS